MCYIYIGGDKPEKKDESIQTHPQYVTVNVALFPGSPSLRVGVFEGGRVWERGCSKCSIINK